jgi:hypothetical protein
VHKITGGFLAGIIEYNNNAALLIMISDKTSQAYSMEGRDDNKKRKGILE